MLPRSKQQEIEHVRVEIFQSITYSVINNKSPQSCCSVNTFQPPEEKQQKKYANIHRNTINDGDSQTSLFPIFFGGEGVSVQRLLCSLLPLFSCSPIALFTCSLVPLFPCSLSHVFPLSARVAIQNIGLASFCPLGDLLQPYTILTNLE